MSHHTATGTDVKIEEILGHIAENSWLNIVDLDGWAGGLSEDAAAAEEWCIRNTNPAATFFKAWDCGNAEASHLLGYFSKLGMPSCAGTASTGKYFYTYKK